jgi:multidrug transporter EmrE-like cation transporter
MHYVLLFFATILQNLSFTVVSRARNSDNIMFHALAAIASNGLWFIVANSVIAKPNSVPLGITYVVGTVSGSILGHYVSMNFLEKWFKKKRNGNTKS